MNAERALLKYGWSHPWYHLSLDLSNTEITQALTKYIHTYAYEFHMFSGNPMKYESSFYSDSFNVAPNNPVLVLLVDVHIAAA